MIADNRLNETSTWDERLLAEQSKELSLQDLDFSIDATGFEIGEIDVIPSLNSDPVVSKSGDLWLLGKHRVYCGSALHPSVYRVLMERKRSAMVFTDPPYNVPIAGHVSGLGLIHHREFQMASGEDWHRRFWRKNDDGGPFGSPPSRPSAAGRYSTSLCREL